MVWGSFKWCARTVLGPGKGRGGPEVEWLQRGREGMSVVEVNKVKLTGFSVPGDGGN